MNLFVTRTWLEAKFAKDEKGASMVEYILLVALIALAVIAAVVFLKNQVNSKFNDAGSKLSSARSEEHTSKLQSQFHLVCRLLLATKKQPSDHCKQRQLEHLGISLLIYADLVRRFLLTNFPLHYESHRTDLLLH